MWSERVFQVAIPAHNEEKNIIRCLDSVSSTLAKEEWHLVIGDDASTDNTVDVVKKHVGSLSCQSHLILKFPKAKNLPAARNRVLSICGAHSATRPAILGMDADDIMLADRAKLFDTAKEEDASLVVGPWRFSSAANFKKYKYTDKPLEACTEKLEFGWWATLFHGRIIPPDGRLFTEEVDLYEDIILWNRIKYLDYPFKITPANEDVGPVHHYIMGEGSSVAKDKKKTNKARSIMWEMVKEIKLQGELINQSKVDLEPDPELQPDYIPPIMAESVKAGPKGKRREVQEIAQKAPQKQK